jgi:DNA-binding transcriptional ArsR family regulator
MSIAIEEAGLLVSVTELARIKGVSQPAISQRLARFESDGLVTPIREGRNVKIKLAEWDQAANETTDPAKLAARETSVAIAEELAGETPPPANEATAAAPLLVEPSPSSPPATPMLVDTAIPPAPAPARDRTYTEQLTRKATYDADLRELEIKRARGELVEIADVQEAMSRCAEILVREIGQLSARADDVAAAVAVNGATGAREVLRKIERELRASLANAMTLVADEEDQVVVEAEAA